MAPVGIGDVAALALEQLAKLQVPRWGDPTLLEHPLLVSSVEGPAALQMFYKVLEPGFLERCEKSPTSEYAQMVTKVGDILDRQDEL